MKGNNNFSKGSLVKLRIPNVFRGTKDQILNELSLRLWDVSHTVSTKGWTTQLSLVQDEVVFAGGVVV